MGRGGWSGTIRCTKRAIWQGVGKGNGEEGTVPPSQAPTGWESHFLAGKMLGPLPIVTSVPLPSVLIPHLCASRHSSVVPITRVM